MRRGAYPLEQADYIIPDEWMDLLAQMDSELVADARPIVGGLTHCDDTLTKLRDSTDNWGP